MKLSNILIPWLTFTFWPFEAQSILQMELQLDRVEVKSQKEFAESFVRVRKLNRTTYSLNGTVFVWQDIDESYELSFKFAYSSLGNNQFNEYPMKVPRKSMCQYIVNEYTEYQYLWASFSNLPQVEKGTKEYCPIPKGEYWFKDLVPDASWIPPVVPTGLWRMTYELLDAKDEAVFEGVMFMKLSKNFG